MSKGKKTTRKEKKREIDIGLSDGDGGYWLLAWPHQVYQVPSKIWPDRSELISERQKYEERKGFEKEKIEG